MWGKGETLKTKNSIIVLSVVLNLVLGFMVYQETTKEDKGPVNVGLSFKEAVRAENYEVAKSLMSDGRNAQISNEILEEINKIMGENTSFHTYEVLTFDNGEMVLLNLTPDKKYEIQDVKIVPEEVRGIFQ